jgi:hypothetical protein
MTTELQASFAAAVGGADRLASSFSNRTFRNLEERAAREISEGVAAAVKGCEEIERTAARLKLADPALLEELKAEHVARIRTAWAAYQHAGTRTANWMITGPARFPVERNRKRMDTEHRRLTEYLAAANGVVAWAEKRIRRHMDAQLGAVGVADRELEDARARLAARERRQVMMREANKVLRKHRGKPGAAELIAAELAGTFPEISPSSAALMLKPDCCGRYGFADFQLSNNSAEIRRLRDRVAVLERRAADVEAAACNTAEDPELELAGGVRIVENKLEQRLQIFFPDKPSAELRGRLKGRGFRWAPSAGAWQRQLTANAIEAARAIVAA